MRHYYRFMELEPVLEQEEDSVGEASPTSSMGSPSFSPPPDAWAQISSKDYHDPLSSHLLQEHLDLQRAYRLLEVQLQKYDSRASRDLQKMKDALPAQERLREELQRAKEREAALRGEIYDLHEQNELLEFRILELEECQENASTRSGLPGSRDVATETDTSDVTDAGQTSLPVDTEAQRIQERLGDAPVAEPGSATHGCETRLAPGNEDCSALTNTLEQEQRVQGHTEDTTPNPLSEGISCTLCRRLPRRRSIPEPFPTPPDQRDSLRKSKSDGEIITRRSGSESEAESEKGESSKKLKDIANVKKLDGGEGPGRVHRCVGTEVSVKEEGVQVDMGRTPFFSGGVEDQVRTMKAMLSSIYEVIQETRVEVECTNSELREEVQTLESTVQRLKEEGARGLGGEGSTGPPPVRRSRSLSFSKECYCCSQDLQPNLQEVISKLQQVMGLITNTGVIATFDPDKPEEKDDEDIPRSDERKYEKDKREGTDETGMSSKHEHKEEDEEDSRTESLNESNCTQRPRREELSGASEAMPSWKTGGRQPTQTKETSPPPVKKTTSSEATPIKQFINERIKSKMYQDEWALEPRPEDYVFMGSFESQEAFKPPETRRPEVPPKRGVVTDPGERFREYDACVMMKRTDEAIRHLEELAPLPEEKTKPVLRRWREQLLVRRDRVQPWRIEMLDFPKRMPSVV